ncbi:MAG: histidine triad (HIT) family protein [Chloroflexi bacterium]|jgi:histidine triad (HIT) family protein|nr:MAG: histidine triad (HIT) family protein [Chloroflexota bacterium]
MDCVFCEIIAKRSPANFRYEDDDLIVIDNQLTWVPVMLMVIPRQHMTQEELWRSPLMPRASGLAVEMGEKYCPRGFRLLSNFGRNAMQSQPHGHLHVLGGTFLGHYVRHDA